MVNGVCQEVNPCEASVLIELEIAEGSVFAQWDLIFENWRVNKGGVLYPDKQQNLDFGAPAAHYDCVPIFVCDGKPTLFFFKLVDDAATEYAKFTLWLACTKCDDSPPPLPV